MEEIQSKAIQKIQKIYHELVDHPRTEPGKFLAGITEEFFETLLLITVIVRVEHTEKQALSKTTGTDEEEIARLLLQLWQKHRLIDII